MAGLYVFELSSMYHLQNISTGTSLILLIGLATLVIFFDFDLININVYDGDELFVIESQRNESEILSLYTKQGCC